MENEPKTNVKIKPIQQEFQDSFVHSYPRNITIDLANFVHKAGVYVQV